VRDEKLIIEELLATGLGPAQTVLLFELVRSLSTGLSGVNPVESPGNRTLEKRRAWDRERQRRKREAERLSTLSTVNPPESTGTSTGNADVCLIEDKKKVSQVKEVSERKKGSRLLSGARVSDEFRAIAIEHGCPPDRVDKVWEEFVDYWSDIPGQKGCRLSWRGTWRNRVKSIFQRSSHVNGTSNNRADPAAGRATAREADFVTSVAKGALQFLHRGEPAGEGREAPDGVGSADVIDLGKRAENAR